APKSIAAEFQSMLDCGNAGGSQLAIGRHDKPDGASGRTCRCSSPVAADQVITQKHLKLTGSLGRLYRNAVNLLALKDESPLGVGYLALAVAQDHLTDDLGV